MSWSIRIPRLHEQSETRGRTLIFTRERTAIHSGRLGDIVYSLPTCRQMGINHLVINVHADAEDPRRTLTYRSACEIVPLLLAQTYLKKVSICETDMPLQYAWAGIDGIEFNFDAARNVDAERIAPLVDLPAGIRWLAPDGAPVHLAERFAACLGTTVNLHEPWLEAAPSPLAKDGVVVSITPRWRSFPDEYWRLLLAGLSPVFLVGHPGESGVRIPGATWVEARDHLELASLIAGARLFVGTVSFPFAIAEGLKARRLVEPCYRKLDAFPIGTGGSLLSPDVCRGRAQIARALGLKPNSDYSVLTRKLRMSPRVQWFALGCVRRAHLPPARRLLTRALSRLRDLLPRVPPRRLGLARRM